VSRDVVRAKVTSRREGEDAPRIKHEIKFYVGRKRLYSR
jgi:hypothetical protein